MNCKEVEKRDISDLYLLHRLNEAERDEFEKHYFECESCFAQLQAGLMVQAELKREPRARGQAGGAILRRMWAFTPALVTTALLIAAGIWWYSARGHQPAQRASSSPTQTTPEVSGQFEPPSLTASSLEELARVEPPPYTAVVLRGAQDEAQEAFRQTMKYYSRGNYVQAIPGLRMAVRASPRTARFHFYLGACYLLTGQTDLAIESFRKTISLGEPTYSEPAHFYLAKAYLRKKEIPSAKDELQETIRLHGSLAGDSAKILHQLGK
jgi:tetratricopeptide (TPR) repeat protein